MAPTSWWAHCPSTQCTTPSKWCSTTWLSGMTSSKPVEGSWTHPNVYGFISIGNSMHVVQQKLSHLQQPPSLSCSLLVPMTQFPSVSSNHMKPTDTLGSSSLPMAIAKKKYPSSAPAMQNLLIYWNNAHSTTRHPCHLQAMLSTHGQLPLASYHHATQPTL